MTDHPASSWFTSGKDPLCGKRLPVTLTFEGGGARGLLHIGALRALEQVERSAQAGVSELPLFDVRGVNGTSIGSLIAALYSVGYHSADMLSEKEPYSRILSLAGLAHAKDLLNARQRFAIWCLQNTFMFPILVMAAFVLAYLTGILVVSSPIGSALVSVIIATSLVYVAIRQCIMGLGSARKLSEYVDLALAAKLNGYDEARIAERRRNIGAGTYEKMVTFGDIGRANSGLQEKEGDLSAAQDRYRRLAIIVTNLTTGRLEKFSVARTPNVYVGDAVAASCSVPFLFKPYEITQSPENQVGLPRVPERMAFKYFDGGITSNLPVWTSDVPRALNPDMVSVSFGVIDDIKSPASNPKELIAGLARAALFGAGVLETRRTRNVPYLLRSKGVGLLSFSLKHGSAIKEIEGAQRDIIEAMVIRSKRRGLFANASRALCLAIAESAPLRFKSPTQSEEGRDAIRVIVLEPTRFGQNGLKRYLLYCSDPEMPHFQDDNLVYHGGHSLPGKAWRQEGQRFVWASQNQDFPVDHLIVGPRAWPRNSSDSDPRLRSQVWPCAWACAYKLSFSSAPDRYGVDDISDPRRACVVLVQSNVALGAFGSNASGKVSARVEEAIRAFDQRLSADLRALIREDMVQVASTPKGEGNG